MNYILKQQNFNSPAVKGMYSPTGGVQGKEGQMFGKSYPIASFFWDSVVESFAGTHDYLGG